MRPVLRRENLTNRRQLHICNFIKFNDGLYFLTSFLQTHKPLPSSEGLYENYKTCAVLNEVVIALYKTEEPNGSET